MQDGRIVYQRGYGYAKLDYGRQSPEMVYDVGSVSRQFTAAAIVLLAHEGHVALGDSMRRYIPELRTYGRTMTIRHLAGRVRNIRFVRQQEARQ